MKTLRMRHAPLTFIATTGAILLGMFQNCSPVSFDSNLSKPVTESNTPIDASQPDEVGDLDVCNGVSCDLNPLTNKPAVTTILMALGDEANNQLVVNGASAQLIAESVVRYTSPKAKPKILLVHDHAAGAEDPEDTKYVANVLLGRYDVTKLSETSSGLTDQDVEGFDVIWFNNPGHPMGSQATRDVLLRFKGGVILQGDDLTRAKDQKFDLTSLTGLKHIDNGTEVVCDGKTYAHDNNVNFQYRVTLNPDKIPGAEASTIAFRYGNDIDNTEIARRDLEVLAYAKGGHDSCTAQRPAIVRYLKE